MYPRNMVCFRHTAVNTLHIDDDDNMPLTNPLPMFLLFAVPVTSFLFLNPHYNDVCVSFCVVWRPSVSHYVALRRKQSWETNGGGKDRDTLLLVGAVGQQW